MKAIRDYLALDNLVIANAVVSFIAEAAEGLMQNPFIGKSGRPNYRELVLSKYPYTIHYRVYAHKVGVVAVVHQTRKYY